jgi:uncharacterized membrane protein YqjE
MEASLDTQPHLGDASKRIAQRTFVIVENRLQLLMVEAEEERERILRAGFLGGKTDGHIFLDRKCIFSLR